MFAGLPAARRHQRGIRLTNRWGSGAGWATRTAPRRLLCPLSPAQSCGSLAISVGAASTCCRAVRLDTSPRSIGLRLTRFPTTWPPDFRVGEPKSSAQMPKIAPVPQLRWKASLSVAARAPEGRVRSPRRSCILRSCATFDANGKACQRSCRTKLFPQGAIYGVTYSGRAKPCRLGGTSGAFDL